MSTRTPEEAKLSEVKNMSDKDNFNLLVFVPAGNGMSFSSIFSEPLNFEDRLKLADKLESQPTKGMSAGMHKIHIKNLRDLFRPMYRIIDTGQSYNMIAKELNLLHLREKPE